jgi:hypothetical protein
MNATTKKEKPPTWKQNERQRTRKAGRYSKMNPCELCGKSAGADYFSDDRCNTTSVDRIGAAGVPYGAGGPGLVLCGKCASRLAGLDDVAYLAAFKGAV